METVSRFLEWFTPARRKRVYRTLIPLLLILVGHGVITAEDAQHVIASLGYALGAGALTLADRNVNDE